MAPRKRGKLTSDFRPPMPLSSSKPQPLAPRDDCERRLLEIWEEILGVSNFGIDEDFFHLGGDSLRAFELCVHIEREFNQTFHTARLGQPCTIERLAGMLRSGLDATRHDEISDYLFEMRAGEGLPLFCFPGHGGNVAQFHDLAESLADGQSVQGVLLPDLSKNSEVPRTMEELASFSIAEMRRLQPKGPYFLSGYSFGATLAYEVAQQLSAKKECVGMLALLDPSLTPLGLVSFLDRAALRMRQMHSLTLADKARAVAAIFRRHWRKMHGIATRSLPAALPDRVNIAITAAERMYNTYQYAPYPGKVTMFYAEDQQSDYSPQPRDLSYWLGLGQEGLEVYSVPGDHFTFLQYPNVTRLSELMCLCLDRARLEGRGQGPKSDSWNSAVE
jgi:thioesterase domain-containing protein/acyl carrier protein